MGSVRPQAGDRERQHSWSSSGDLVPQSRLARGPSARDGAKHCPDAVHRAALPHRSRTARESVWSKATASSGGSRRKRRSSVRAEPCSEPAGPAPAHPHGALPSQPDAVRLDLPRNKSGTNAALRSRGQLPHAMRPAYVCFQNCAGCHQTEPSAGELGVALPPEPLR
jgi:hypothetical protein